MDKKIENIPYLKILENAWKITWKNRFLWWFGFFLALSSFGGVNFPFNDIPEDYKNETFDFISQNQELIITLSIFAAVFLLLLITLGFLGRGALIDSVWKKIKDQKVDFKSGIKEGKKNFWKVFLISFFSGLFLFVLAVLLLSPIFILVINKNYSAAILMVFIALLIFIPILVLVVFMKNYGLIYAVLAKTNFWNSLEGAYNLFRKNILTSLIMGLIFIPINMVLGMTFFILIFILGIIFFLLGFGLYYIIGKMGIFVVISIGVLIFVLILILIQSIYQVFSQAVWILFFREIASPKNTQEIFQSEKVLESPSEVVPIIETNKEI